ncbi:hypothetical protein CLV98_11211 [Dyadobacter jejuensis]|uniref:Uncharacterized protein n=1 Tax=Dyadobacter jejuensis TaxID=1082580 RepID=A0A316B091_9BACT|nr:hypothetical protein [Dyadobacter jejuensis]PWJ55917.1 hypothetical protein CLV98_11211 [Dyadobacter jejuensis]
MKRKQSNINGGVAWYTLIGILLTLGAMPAYANGEPEGAHTKKTSEMVLENRTVKVTVDQRTGSFAVLEKTSGQLWKSDPWEDAAGLMEVNGGGIKGQTVNISKIKDIRVTQKSKWVIGIEFENPILEGNVVAEGVRVQTELRLDADEGSLDVAVVAWEAGKYRLSDLRYPARAFSLETDVDRGAVVIPQKQGMISPSYIFPMNGGLFAAGTMLPMSRGPRG